MLTACRDKERMVLISTTYGDIKVKLYNETPQHLDNFVKLSQAGTSVMVSAKLDKTLPATVVRVAAGVLATHQLGAMFGPINVERA